MRTGHLKNSYFKRDEMKQRIFLYKYLQICNLKSWGDFSSNQTKVTWFSKYEKTLLYSFTFANWRFNCTEKISVILWQRVSHFLFLDTNRQCASYEKKSRMSWLLRCAVTRNLASQFGELFPPAVIYVSGYSKTHWVEKLIYVW